jgi:hypothetical protein
MSGGPVLLIALGIVLYAASWVLFVGGTEAGAQANPAESRSVATTETPGVVWSIGGFEHLAAAVAASRVTASFPTQ